MISCGNIRIWGFFAFLCVIEVFGFNLKQIEGGEVMKNIMANST